MRRLIYNLITSVLILLASMESHAQAFLHASGKKIVDGNGNEVILKGIGTGNWLLNEGYMMKTEDFAGTHTQFRQLLTATIGLEKTAEYYDTWLNNHFTRRDVDSMQVWGFNSIRVAMHYKWFTLPIEDEPVPGQDTWLEDGFVRIDSLLAWCGDNGIYLILDLHGAPGGQGHDRNISDYDPAKPSLWESTENRRKTVALWRKLAQRYADEPWIGGYDLINEPNWELPNGTLLKQTYIDITSAIRQVDPDHMIIIEGNWFANDYTGLTPPWDNNMVYSFHKYWNYNTQGSIQWMIDLRNSYNIPIWLGETGENSNSWFTDVARLAEENDIGWSFWPVKKAGINNVLMVPESQQYNNLLSYWQNGTPYMTADQAFSAVLDWANNHRIENCSVQRDVIDAMIRQPFSNATRPYVDQNIADPIHLSDYDLGKCSFAYWDTDTANYHLNTNVYTAWNSGWAYRSDGVDIEECTDSHPSANGYDIGWTNDNEWLQYTVHSDTAAAYQVLFRSACAGTAAIVHLQVNGTDVSPGHQLPVTGGWQTWMSSTVNDVIVPAGNNRIRLYFDRGGSNVGFIHFLNPKPVTEVPFTFLTGATDTEGTAIFVTVNKPVTAFGATASDFAVFAGGNSMTVDTVFPNPGNPQKLVIRLGSAIGYGQSVTISYSGNTIQSGGQILETFSNKPVKNNLPKRFIIPARIQAEDFDYNYGFQLETCTDVGGGQNLAYANNGDYVDYNLSIPEAGEYNFRFRLASMYANGSFSVRLGTGTDFTELKAINVSQTGGWQTWITKEVKIVLPKGNYTLRLFSLSGEYNLNWFEIALPTGINDVPQLKQFRIYPNPNDGIFYAEAEFNSGTPLRMTLYDVIGNPVWNCDGIKSGSFCQRIDNPGIRAGMYFLKLFTDSGEYTTKVVVN